MANSAPIISETGLKFAVDIVNAGYRTGHYKKVAFIGDSLLVPQASGTMGGFMRAARCPVWDGQDATSSSSAGLLYTAISQPGYSSSASTAAGGTSLALGTDQNFCPHGIVEHVFNANVIPAGNALANLLFETGARDPDAIRQSLYQPSFEDVHWNGDWITEQVDASGDITFTVFFYNNPDGVDTNRVTLQARDGVTALATSAAFGTYSATNEMVAQTLTVTAAQIGATSPGFALDVRMVDGAALDGKNVIVCGAEESKNHVAGLALTWLMEGGSNPSTWIDDSKYSADTWDRLALTGVTNVIISLDANGGETPSEHKANLRELISRITAKIPDCKFCLLAPYDQGNSDFDDRVEASYEVALEDGHLFLNVARYLPPNEILGFIAVGGDGITNDWQSGVFYYSGDAARESGTYYVCTDALTSTTQPSLDAAHWTPLSNVDANAILRVVAASRSYITGDNSITHPNRARGGAIYGGAMWAMLELAAEQARMQLGEGAIFYK
jgi:hypothetical protein